MLFLVLFGVVKLSNKIVGVVV